MKKTDAQVQHDVIAELDWEPLVDAANIGVAVNDGVVTLSGFVPRYPEKVAAEKAARRVSGVGAIAEEIKVRLASDPRTADHEIAKRIIDTFAWNVLIPEDRIMVKVENGLVTLSGTVDYFYQNREARKAAGLVSGVTGVSNQIAVRTMPTSSDVKDRIATAIRRQADIDASSISVRADGSTITLDGTVKAWNERSIAERAAWSAPGVTSVKDNIEVAF